MQAKVEKRASPTNGMQTNCFSIYKVTILNSNNSQLKIQANQAIETNEIIIFIYDMTIE